MDFKVILEHHILDHSFNNMFYLGKFPVNFTKHVLMMWIASFLLLLTFLLFKRTSRRLSILLEMIVGFIRNDVVLPTLGHSGKKYLPYFLTLFFFILFCNLLGMIPGAATATGNIAVTAALSICTFFLIHIAGIREQGFVHYVQSIVPSGMPAWLLPLMFPIELIGFFTKAFALSIRLFMNMIAGHIVILAFLGLIFIFGEMSPAVGYATSPLALVMALFIYLLELVIVVPLQAFIFTFLTALFVGAAVHPDH